MLRMILGRFGRGDDAGTPVRRIAPWGIALLVVASADAVFASEGGGHGGSVARILIELIVIILGAKIGGAICQRVGQPAVLGELIVGVVLGNIYLLGWAGLEPIKTDLVIEILAEIGVIILLFEVGLESKLGDMLKVGVSSLLVAALGVIAPFFIGWGISAWFWPAESVYVHLFIGATLTATSVGITARVLKDIHKIHTSESRIILGAAVIDDVMGLVILAIITGVIGAVSSGTGDGLSSLDIIWLVGKALLFLVGSVIVGHWLFPRLFRVANFLQVHGMLLASSLMICFGLSYLAALVGLAPIVGAFAAGLVLEEVHYRELPMLGEKTIEDLIAPISLFLVPVFFVSMGMKVDLPTFGNTAVLGFALVLTLGAILGKQASSFGVLGRETNRWIVGLGMIPRGEVGLIFAAIGAKLMLDGKPVVSSDIYSAVVIMVVITTMMTPPVLGIMFRAQSKRGSGNT